MFRLFRQLYNILPINDMDTHPQCPRKYKGMIKKGKIENELLKGISPNSAWSLSQGRGNIKCEG